MMDEERAGYVAGLITAAGMADAVAIGVELALGASTSESATAKAMRALAALLRKQADETPDA